MTGPTTSGRRRRATSEQVAMDLLDAAAIEFAAYGYDGASTRAIADRAGVFQAQIGYHIGTKFDLWAATVARLFEQLGAALRHAAEAAEAAGGDAATVMTAVIRAHVHHTAAHPELHRIMDRESAVDSERLVHIVTNHVQPAFAGLEALWERVRSAGSGRDIGAEEVFLVMVQLGAAPFVAKPLLRELHGERAEALWGTETHADRMVDLLLGPSST